MPCTALVAKKDPQILAAERLRAVGGHHRTAHVVQRVCTHSVLVRSSSGVTRLTSQSLFHTPTRERQWAGLAVHIARAEPPSTSVRSREPVVNQVGEEERERWEVVDAALVAPVRATKNHG
jgi:hypothetical protein